MQARATADAAAANAAIATAAVPTAAVAPAAVAPAAAADRVRRFNRFYTRQIGLLGEQLLDSGFSLTESRLLYELAHREGWTAADLCRLLGLNAGYLSRLLAGFTRRGLIERARSATDARATTLRLTDAGRRAYQPLNQASQQQVQAMLERLSPPKQRQLADSMRRIEHLLSDAPASYLLRPPQPGDMGWVTSRHGVLYAQEYGWDSRFEALVAGIVAEFVRDFKPDLERCWIAEQEGDIVGSVFVVRASDSEAKLRLLYVEPSARGLGIGRRLVDECLRFARQAGYRSMVLWTNSVLSSARRIYQQAGFEMVAQEAHRSFGKDLVGETWRLQF